jgi:two-component system, response regulator, stage 0 sporulation protein F
MNKDFNILTALSGEEGINIIEKTKNIKVVVSDMRMPGMNGIEFIKKAKEVSPQIHYFILTAFDITPEITDALNNNLIIKHFKKPLEINLIRQTINKCLSNS